MFFTYAYRRLPSLTAEMARRRSAASLSMASPSGHPAWGEYCGCPWRGPGTCIIRRDGRRVARHPIVGRCGDLGAVARHTCMPKGGSPTAGGRGGQLGNDNRRQTPGVGTTPSCSSTTDRLHGARSSAWVIARDTGGPDKRRMNGQPPARVVYCVCVRARGCV